MIQEKNIITKREEEKEEEERQHHRGRVGGAKGRGGGKGKRKEMEPQRSDSEQKGTSGMGTPRTGSLEGLALLTGDNIRSQSKLVNLISHLCPPSPVPSVLSVQTNSSCGHQGPFSFQLQAARGPGQTRGARDATPRP